VDIKKTFGALLVGGLIAATFSGVTTAQAGIYSKLFPNDRLSVKLLVFVIWFLDIAHTYCIGATIWHYLIANFGDAEGIDYIPTNLALSIAFTALLTLLVHFFFIFRIHRLSMGNLFLTIPLSLLALARVAFACLTTASMIQLRSLKEFVKYFTWSFTTGLSISSGVDFLITACLCFLLWRTQKQTTKLNHVLDKLMRYAFENCALTTLATVVSLICWLVMPHNLIFMGLHFIICKFYANSLLATLNRRKGLLSSVSADTMVSLPVFAKRSFWSKASKLRTDMEKGRLTQITTTVVTTTDDGSSTSPLSPTLTVK